MIGFAVYLGLLEQLWETAPEADAEVLLLYDGQTDLSALRDAVRGLRREGRSVSAQRSEAGGRYRETLDLRGGAEHA